MTGAAAAADDDEATASVAGVASGLTSTSMVSVLGTVSAGADMV